MESRPGDHDVRAELLQLSYPDGTIRARFTLGRGDGVPGELAIAPDGTVLVSDGTRGVLYRLRAGAAALETITHPILRSPQGIAVRPDGLVAYVADWSQGLLRWDLVVDSLVAVTDAGGLRLRGVDGLRLHGASLLAIHNGSTPNRVLRLTLDRTGRSIAATEVLDAPTSLEGEMTVGVVLHGDFVYVSSSAWPFFAESGARRAVDRALPPVVLRAVRLAR